MKKITIPALIFQQAVQKAFAATPLRTTLAVLEGLELKVENGILSVRATDQEIWFRQNLKIESEEKGKILILGNKFPSLVGLIANDEVISLEFIPKGMTLNSSQSKYNFTATKEELPNIEKDFKATGSFVIKAEILKELIGNTLFAATTEKSSRDFNHAFANVAIQSHKDGILKLAGTDGRALVKSNTKVGRKTEIDLLLPYKTASLILKSFTDEEVAVSYSKDLIQFSTDSIFITSRVVDVKYPDFEGVIKSVKCDKEVLFQRSDFLSALKRIYLFTDETTKAVYFNLSKGLITISVNDLDTATDGVEEIPCGYSGNDFSIVFNGKYLQDVISHISSEKVRMKLGEEVKPCIVEPETQNEVEFLGVIFAIRP